MLEQLAPPTNGGSNPTSPLQFHKGDYRVVEIDRGLAQQMQKENHYLHRRAQCSTATGLLYQGNIVGVCLLGTPSNRNLLKGVCGESEQNNVIELTCLWVADEIPNGAESFFIRHSLRFIKKEICISYADPVAGHVGTVYQAAGWTYTGQASNSRIYIIGGMLANTVHRLGKGARGGASNRVGALRKIYGDKLKCVENPIENRKHRYVWFNARKTELLSQLRYKILPYPKKTKKTGV